MLSGGQRQRISIALALLRHPKLLILDEATSALDPKTRAQIDTSMKTLAKDMTIISITHDSSLVQMADIVYEIKNGQANPIKTSSH